MTHRDQDDLWRDFPKTATEFEARFATEEDLPGLLDRGALGRQAACARCKSTRVWTIRDGTTFACADCDHQASLTSGTLLERTRKPLKMWFRAVFEILEWRTSISAKDLQRIMGFGSYKTAWTACTSCERRWAARACAATIKVRSVLRGRPFPRPAPRPSRRKGQAAHAL